MILYGMILTGASMKTGMRAEPVVVEKHFNDAPGDADVDFMLDILVRNAVMHMLDGYVVWIVR
jgi:hypothetical protein